MATPTIIATMLVASVFGFGNGGQHADDVQKDTAYTAGIVKYTWNETRDTGGENKESGNLFTVGFKKAVQISEVVTARTTVDLMWGKATAETNVGSSKNDVSKIRVEGDIITPIKGGSNTENNQLSAVVGLGYENFNHGGGTYESIKQENIYGKVGIRHDSEKMYAEIGAKIPVKSDVKIDGEKVDRGKKIGYYAEIGTWTNEKNGVSLVYEEQKYGKTPLTSTGKYLGESTSKYLGVNVKGRF